MTNDEDDTDIVDWAQRLPDRLRREDDLAYRIDRSGYTAFLVATTGADVNGYELIHRHYHEDEWRRKTISRFEVEREAVLTHRMGEVVEMPDLDDVDVDLYGVDLDEQ